MDPGKAGAVYKWSTEKWCFQFIVLQKETFFQGLCADDFVCGDGRSQQRPIWCSHFSNPVKKFYKVYTSPNTDYILGSYLSEVVCRKAFRMCFNETHSGLESSALEQSSSSQTLPSTFMNKGVIVIL